MVYPNKTVDIKSFWMPYLVYSMAALGGRWLSLWCPTGKKLRMQLQHIRVWYEFLARVNLVSGGVYSMDYQYHSRPVKDTDCEVVASQVCASFVRHPVWSHTEPSASYYLLVYNLFAGLCVVLMQMLIGQLGALPSLLINNKIGVRRMRDIVWNNPIQGGTCFPLGCHLRVYLRVCWVPVVGPCDV